MKMEEICLSERPREKFWRLGPRSMSNGELLAMLLRTGLAGKNVLELAQELLAKSDGRLSRLCEMDPADLCRVPGIGKDKAATLGAAFELGRRWLLEKSDVIKVPIRSADMAWKAMAPIFRGLDHEEFWVMYLNRSNYVIGKEMISVGNLGSTSLDIERILKKMLAVNATALIMFHNHPSGNPNPGGSDIKATNQMKQALEVLGKSLLDHIIIGDSSYYSFSMEEEVTGSCASILSEP